MTISKIKRFGVAPAPNRLALKSPQVYIDRISKANPAWGVVVSSKALPSARTAGALWAASVAVANGCRISEVLRILNHQVQPNGTAWTVGSKGSNSRLLYLGIDPADAVELRMAKGSFLVFPWDYQTIYRACLEYGFTEVLPNHQHRAVTHSGRYRLVQEVAQTAGEVVAGQVIGHRSKATAEYYAHPERCKQKVSKKQPKEKFLTLEDLISFIS